MELTILYEDDELIAVEKPAGIITQRDSTGRDSLLDMVRGFLIKRDSIAGEFFLSAVHRLDRIVSGPVLFAKTPSSAGSLFEAFRSRNVLKYYYALVHNPHLAGAPSRDAPEWKTLSHLLERKRDTVRTTDTATHKTREASLRYAVLKCNESYALLLIDLLTGRRHQIRVQLSAIGCPVAGDRHYGSPDAGSPDAICLHSCRLRFVHPALRTPVEIFSELPVRFGERFPASFGILSELPRLF